MARVLIAYGQGRAGSTRKSYHVITAGQARAFTDLFGTCDELYFSGQTKEESNDTVSVRPAKR